MSVDDGNDSDDGKDEGTGDGKAKKNKIRKACDRCRYKHIGCVVVPGQAKCQACQDSGAVCMFGAWGTAFRTPSR